MTAAYPLSWPQAFPRTKSREKDRFRTTLSGALGNVKQSLAAFARDSGVPLGDVVISSNVSLGETKPADPGVAVWFVWDGLSVSIPVDRYTTVEANLQAIHHIVEARRTELRHGTLALVRATFSGFLALPAPTGRQWREVLNLVGEPNPTVDQIQHHFKIRAAKAHPDVGGSADAMAELTRARADALAEIGAA